MACLPLPPAGFQPWVMYAVVRVTRDPPRLTQWWGGSLVGWVNDSQQAQMYWTAAFAGRLRRALGEGVIVKVYDVRSGEEVE